MPKPIPSMESLDPRFKRILKQPTAVGLPPVTPITVFPTTMRFVEPSTKQLAGLMAAALKLKIPFEARDKDIVVVIDTPMHAFMLGVEQKAYMDRRKARGKKR